MPSAPDQIPDVGFGRRPICAVLAGCAALLAVLVYLNALDNPFVYDDYRLIVENSSLDSSTGLQTILIRDITRPVVSMSYAIDTAIWGRAPFGYHLTSLLLHAVNVILVFYVALLVSEDRARRRDQVLAVGASPVAAAVATALLFAVHPMMTQAVGYISGRSEVAYGCLFLLAFLAGRRWIVDGRVMMGLATGALWLAAMLTKETAVMLPLVLVVYGWFLLDMSGAERRWRLVWVGMPVLAVAAAAGIWRLALLRLVEYRGSAGDWRFALVAIDAFWRYLGLFAQPGKQTIFHALPMLNSPFEPRALADLMGLVVLATGIWYVRRFHSVIAFGLVWFVLIMVPSSVLFALGIGEPLAEHRSYVAAAGLFLAWGAAFAMIWRRVSAVPRRRVLVGSVALLYLATLAAQTVARNTIWSDPIALSQEAERLAPNHWMPRLLLAEAYRHDRRCAEAIPEYQAAIRFNPLDEFPYAKLAGCLIETRRMQDAERTLLDLKAINPASGDAAMGLGVLAVLTNRMTEARGFFAEVLERNPSSAPARELLAFADGTLPAAEHARMCEQMRTAADAFDFDACTRWPEERQK